MVLVCGRPEAPARFGGLVGRVWVDVAFVLRRQGGKMQWGMLGIIKPGFTVDSGARGPTADRNAGTSHLSDLDGD